MGFNLYECLKNTFEIHIMSLNLFIDSCNIISEFKLYLPCVS